MPRIARMILLNDRTWRIGDDEVNAGAEVVRDLYPALYSMDGDAELYVERRGQYGDSEQGFGRVMDALFPDGLTLKGHQDWVRYGLLHQMVGKMARYANNFTLGGHADSLRDIRVYSAMLQAEDEL